MSYAQHPSQSRGSRSFPQSLTDHPLHMQRTDSLEVGGTRCYWSLLTYPHLRFAYVDPVLQSHLGDCAPTIIGRSLLEFVHPDDQEHVRRDLGSSLNPYGSETRVRFSRLSRVKGFLSKPSNPSSVRDQLPYANAPWASAISIDENYMAVNLAITCPLPSTILCFIHATVDLDPGADNDVATAVTVDGQRKRGWTNWCGAGQLSESELRDIWNALENIETASDTASLNSDASNQKFQLLANTPRRQVLISWPPDPASGSDTRPGWFVASNFEELASKVQMDVGPSPNAKTSCTRRLSDRPTLTIGRCTQILVESMYIPYGTIIFACHKVVTVTNLQQNSHELPHTTMSRQSPLLVAYPTPQSHLPLDNGPAQTSSASYSSPLSSSSQYSSQYSYHQPTQGSSNGAGRWSEYSVSGTSASANSGSSGTTSGQQATWSQDRPSQYGSPWSNESHAAASTLIGQDYGRTSPDGYASYGTQLGEHNRLDDIVPPSKKRIISHSSSVRSTSYVSAPGGSTDTPPTTGRRHGTRPPGLMRCASCKSTASPEWRKGPSGKKELCNACGLRYARSKAKKEGNTVRKRKNDRPNKPLPARGSPSPATTVPAPLSVSPQQDYGSRTQIPTPPPTGQPHSYVQSHSSGTTPSVPSSSYLLQYGGSQQYAASSAFYNAAAGLASLNQYSYDRGSYPVGERSGSYGRTSPVHSYDRESREREQERHRMRDRESRLRELDGGSNEKEYVHRSELPPSGSKESSGAGSHE